MPRPRKKDKGLPPNVRRHGRYFQFRPYDPVAKKPGKGIRLCPVESRISEVWRQWEKHQPGPARDTMAWLINQYMASAQFRERTPGCQKQYIAYAKAWCEMPMTSGLFGDLTPEAVDTPMLRRYLDKHTDQPYGSNRRVQFLGTVYAWGFQRGLCQRPPTHGLTYLPETPRTRYVTDAEYTAVLKLAREIAPAYFWPTLELLYLCCMRSVEVRRLVRADVLEAGLQVAGAKKGRTNVVAWSPRLRTAVNALMASRGVPVINPEHDKLLRVTGSTVRWWWSTKLMPQLPESARFRLHDLRAKGISDTQGDKRAAARHRSGSATDRYNRAIEVVPPVR